MTQPQRGSTSTRAKPSVLLWGYCGSERTMTFLRDWGRASVGMQTQAPKSPPQAAWISLGHLVLWHSGTVEGTGHKTQLDLVALPSSGRAPQDMWVHAVQGPTLQDRGWCSDHWSCPASLSPWVSADFSWCPCVPVVQSLTPRRQCPETLGAGAGRTCPRSCGSP